jgi:hypothetical protein
MGTVGMPLPLLTFRLEAVPDMGYDPAADPPRGEVIMKGPVVFRGYYKARAGLRSPCSLHMRMLGDTGLCWVECGSHDAHCPQHASGSVPGGLLWEEPSMAS